MVLQIAQDVQLWHEKSDKTISLILILAESYLSF